MKNTSKLNTIHKIAGIIAFIAIIGFSMTACKDDDGVKDPPIVGSWGNTTGVWTFNNNDTATFAPDGDVIINYTYSIDGTTLTTINIANSYTETRSFSISGNTLTMTLITPTAGTAQTFTKQ